MCVGVFFLRFYFLFDSAIKTAYASKKQNKKNTPKIHKLSLEYEESVPLCLRSFLATISDFLQVYRETLNGFVSHPLYLQSSILELRYQMSQSFHILQCIYESILKNQCELFFSIFYFILFYFFMVCFQRLENIFTMDLFVSEFFVYFV